MHVYECLSEPQLLGRCLGKKTQNAAESLHSVIWSLLPKDENASLTATGTAANEAVWGTTLGPIVRTQNSVHHWISKLGSMLFFTGGRKRMLCTKKNAY